MGLFGEVSTILEVSTLGTVQHPPALEEMATPSESGEEEKRTDIAEKWKMVRRNGSGDTKKNGTGRLQKGTGSCLKQSLRW